MRSRTIMFIPDPFARRRVPLGVIVQHDDRVTFEPIPLPDDIEPTAAVIARMEAEELGERPDAERPDWLGPHVVYGPWHDPRKTLPREVFDALSRATDTPEMRAELEAALEEGRRTVENAWRYRRVA